MKKNGILNTLFSVSGLILLGKIFGFLKQLYVAANFGTTMETDVISLTEGFIANTQYLLVQVLLTSFTAVYIHIHEQDKEAAQRFTADTLKAFSLIVVLIVTLIVLLNKPIAHLLAPSYSPKMTLRVAFYLRILAPVLVLFVWIAVFHAILNSHERFIPGEMTSIIQSVITVLLVSLIGRRIGPATLVVALLVYTLINAMYLGFSARKYLGWSWNNPFRNEEIKTLMRLAGPLVLGYAMIYINQQVDKILTTGLEAGTVTAMGYAAVLSNLVSTFIVTFCSILFTYVTSAIAKNETKRAAELSSHSAFLLGVAFLPISIISVIESDDIVRIAFGRGAFDENSIRIGAAALRGYAFTFVPLALREVFSRLSYGYQDSKHPMLNSSINIVFNILLSVALVKPLGVFGVTLASSVSVAICAVLNTVSVQKLNHEFRLVWLLRRLPWVMAGGAVCAGTAYVCAMKLSEGQALPRFLAVTACALISFFLIMSPLLYQTCIRDDGLRIFGIQIKK